MKIIFNPLSGNFDYISKLDNPLQYKGSIAVNSDFPTISNVKNGWFYTITADVTDDDATKTNTGMSFYDGDEIAWDGSTWTVIGSLERDDLQSVTDRGATTDVESTFSSSIDLSDSQIKNTGYIDFSTGLTIACQEGRVHWSDDDGTLCLGMPGGNVELQIGQENLIRVTNDESITIADGGLVYVSGAVGNNPKVMLADNTDYSNTGSRTIAMATEDILSNHKGYVTTFGLVRGVNTSGCSAGNVLYLGSTPGTFTNIKPSSPSEVVEVGYCLRSHATEGVVFVTVDHKGWKRAFAVGGDMTGFEKAGVPPTDSKIIYNPLTQQITIQPTGTHFNVWYKGEKHQVSSPITLSHPDVTGSYFLKWQAPNATPTFSSTPWDILEDIPASYVYYNKDLADGFVFEERHGASRNRHWHYAEHFTKGTYWHQGEGLAIDGYTLQPGTPTDVTNRFYLEAGEIHDEDINNQQPQTISGEYLIFERTGADGV